MGIISKANAEHYQWGDQCDGWRLLNEKGLSLPDTMGIAVG